MDLATAAEIVTEIVGKTDADTVAFAKTLFRRREEYLWHQADWRDLLYYWNQSVAASSGVVHCPAGIDHIVAIRKGSRTLAPIRQLTLYSINPGAYDNTTESDPIYFTHLPPTVMPEPVTGDASIYATHAGLTTDDNGKTVQVLAWDDTGTKRTLTFTVPFSSPTTYTAASVGGSTWDYIEDIKISAALSADVAINSTSGATITITAGSTTAARYNRVQLVEANSSAITLTCLGKQSKAAMENDTDEFPIPLLNDCRIAFTVADLLERQRQYGKAAAKRQEAMGMLQFAKEHEAWRSPFPVRIIPHAETEIGTINDGFYTKDLYGG